MWILCLYQLCGRFLGWFLRLPTYLRLPYPPVLVCGRTWTRTRVRSVILGCHVVYSLTMDVTF